MSSWEYKAYTADYKIVDGHTSANSFPELAVQLRQQGLQIIEATKLTKEKELALNRLQKMQHRVCPSSAIYEDTATTNYPTNPIRRLLSELASKFMRRRNVRK
jgi:hypothetical protein